MKIYLNGVPREVKDAISVSTLAEHLDLGSRLFVVEINGTIIPRSQHSLHLLQERDAVEIIEAVGGG